MNSQTSSNDPRRKRDDFEELAGEPSRDDEDREAAKQRERADDVEDLSDEPVRDDDRKSG